MLLNLQWRPFSHSNGAAACLEWCCLPQPLAMNSGQLTENCLLLMNASTCLHRCFIPVCMKRLFGTVPYIGHNVPFAVCKSPWYTEEKNNIYCLRHQTLSLRTIQCLHHSCPHICLSVCLLRRFVNPVLLCFLSWYFYQIYVFKAWLSLLNSTTTSPAILRF